MNPFSLFRALPGRQCIVPLGVVTLLSIASLTNAENARFIQVVLDRTDDTRFHLGELEAFQDEVVPDELGGASFDGLSTSTNDIGDGTLTAFNLGASVPEVGTTSSLEHGGANTNPNNLLEAGGAVWSTGNGLGVTPQYTLDLGDTFDVTTVRMWPRADGCCDNRWRNLEVNLYADDGTGNPGDLIATSADATGGVNDDRLANQDRNHAIELNFPLGIDKTDADGDMIPDQLEVDSAGNPVDLVPGTDTDGDGLNDEEEVITLDANGDFVRPQFETDPTDDDTDDDTVLDGAEVNGTANVWTGTSNTGAPGDPSNPLVQDTDGDGINDGDEIAGTNGFVTNPAAADTDGDSAADDVEVEKGTDPTDPDSRPDGILELNTLAFLPTGNHVFLAGGETFDAYVHNDGSHSWLLVGRGRNGWEFDADGQGATEDVGDPSLLGTVDAFSPAMYNEDIINDLITASGKDLTGVEIRISRAANVEGTVYSEVRWRSTGQTIWRNNFDTEYGVEHEVVAGAGVAGAQEGLQPNGNTRDTEIGGNDGDRVFTWGWANHGGQKGFSYGSAVSGVANNDPDTFMWELGNENHAIPYTELYIRLLDPQGGSLPDTDGDGLFDLVEQTIIDADPNDAFATFADVLPGDDFDNDGLSNIDEQDNFASPINSDTDGDAILDGEELAGTKNVWTGTTNTGAPGDPTNPGNADTDGDGLSDGEEIVEGADGWITNPAEADTDGGGKPDGADFFPLDPNRGESITVVLDVGVGEAEIIEFQGPDDLLLDPATAVIAVDVYGNGDSVINGVTFRTDGQTPGAGTATEGPVSVTTSAANQINDWAAVQSYTGAEPASASALAGVMQDIRWEGAPNPLTVDIEGLAPGTPYHLQLLTNEGADRARFWDISVNGEFAVDNYSSEGAEGIGVWSPQNGFAYTGVFEAQGDGSINVIMQADIGGAPRSSAPGTDGNPILQAVIVHLFDTPSIALEISRAGDELELSWSSEPGNLYDVLSDLPGNLSIDNPPEMWPVWNGNEMIAATPPRNTLTIPLPAAPERYFAVTSYPPPPVIAFSDDFESGQGSWVTGTFGTATSTEWEFGTPDPGVTGGPDAALSGSNCFGTNLSGAYEDDTQIFLRSPAIDLVGVVAGKLKYWRFHDIETMFDAGSVLILDAADDSEIGVLEDGIEGTIDDWEEATLNLPAEAIGKTIKIEFRLDGDDFNASPQAGFYIDDVVVEGTPE